MVDQRRVANIHKGLQRMALYETVFIARQDISATQVEALTDTFAAVIAEGNGEVKKREYWGLRTLAFRIKKNRKGHYVLFNLDAPSAAVTEMERNMRINEDILRFLTVRVDALEEGPSAVMQSRGRSDDRPRRSYGGDRRDEGRDRDEPRDAPPRDVPAAVEGAEA
jgi:small subunit ribosomal protein S6